MVGSAGRRRAISSARSLGLPAATCFDRDKKDGAVKSGTAKVRASDLGVIMGLGHVLRGWGSNARHLIGGSASLIGHLSPARCDAASPLIRFPAGILEYSWTSPPTATAV